jgi:amino acid adenylation domain-containing protein
MAHVYPVTQVSNTPLQLCIYHLLQDQAERTPNALAILAPGRAPLTYGRLRRQIDDVMQNLDAMGLGRNDRVALVLPNGPEMGVAFLSVAAGATCAPLNPAFSANEFDFYLADLHAKSVIMQVGIDSPARAVAQARGIPIIELLPVLEAEAGIFILTSENHPRAARHEFAQPEDIALMVHTSGTTSRPKIVPLTHANICAAAYDLCNAAELVKSDRCLNVMPMFHFHGLISAMLVPLMVGASVVCTPGFYAPQFFAWMAEFRPTWFTAVPTIHQAILACAAHNHEIIARNPVRFIRSASAPLPPQVLAELERAFNAPVIEGYGTTEAPLIASNPLPPHKRKLGSVGVTGGCEVAIINDLGALLPAGEIGEIIVRGASVIQGYENNPMANRNAIMNGWFRTGDQGFLDSDGYLFITGCLKELINRGGEKISPREVEEVLMEHPAVSQAATFAIPHAQLGEDVAAAIVLRENASATAREIREFAGARLAYFKVPRQVVFVREIPTGATGKVRRIGLAERLDLPALDQGQPAEKTGYTAPRTPAEAELARIWAQALGLKRVDVRDDFFELGGHSLLATQLISRIRETMYVEISFLSFFETPTVADMAESIEAASRVGSALQAPPIHPVPKDRVIPLSYAQERLWFLDQLEPSCAAYNMASLFRLKGPLNVTALKQSLSEIVRRHEILRTTFPAEDGRPVQAIAPALPWMLPVVDLRQVPGHKREVQVRALAREEGQRPFDMAQGPLQRAMLLRLAAEEHVLLLIIHHSIFDGWSMGVFVQELTELYPAFCAGQPPSLPKLPIQYVDYATWQRQLLQGEVLDRQLAYWKQQLAGAPAVLELPSDQPRPAVQTFRGARQSLLLSPSLWAALEALSQREGATLFMVLLAAFQVLLYRYTGQQDICVGTPIAGRTRTEVEGLIGFFANILVLRTDLSGTPTFRELLRRVREGALGAYMHQDLPFERLVEELQPARTLSYSPLFQVMLALQNVPPVPTAMAGLKLHQEFIDIGTAKFDLSLFLVPQDQGLNATLEYSTDLFEAATIRRMLGHWQKVLDGVVAQPDVPIATIPLLTEEEQHQLLRAWNNTTAQVPEGMCLYELFETQAERVPDHIAVISPSTNQRLTYCELNRRANQLAHYLRRLGVGPDVLVGICLERSAETLTGLLGILKAGGGYVPFDLTFPKERIRMMMEDTGAPVIVTQESLLELMPEHTQIVCLDRDWPVISLASVERPEGAGTPDSSAYVIYTSGSTGRPKGVQIMHCNVVNFITSMCREPGFSNADAFLTVLPISFDFSVNDIFLPLAAGAKIVIASRDDVTDGSRLMELLNRFEITVLNATPSTWRLLLEAGWKGSPQLTALCGGEALTSQLAESLLACCGALWNLYGPTETTVFSSIQKIKSTAEKISIGKSIANTQMYNLDSHLQAVPIGVPGELYIGGIGLARGYLNRPDLTAEKFISNPFSDEPGTRLYKTGDLARYLPDGNLEYLGRLDHQVKIRGFRIELGEVEAVLTQHSAIRQAVVLAREQIPGDTRLVAYLVPTRDPAPTTSVLRSFLKAKLPASMIPSAFVALEALPLTPSGKVDRNALPKPDGGRPELESGFVAPYDAFERQLTYMWEDLLGVQPIGVQDDFFELGGHSLLAVQLFAHIEKLLGIRLPLVMLFQRPTIAALAHGLRHHGEAAAGALPVEMPHEYTVSDRISHPIARYLPSQYHPHVRRTYQRLKYSSLGRALRALYIRQGKTMTQRLFSYTPMQLENTLKTIGITTGDTVLMHSAFRVFNGFAGTPDQVITSVLKVIGESGNLAMVSMPYMGRSAAYLQTGVSFDVRQTRSAMGVITEIFRHTPGVVRSLNPAHPILAWGPAAPWIIADHEHTRYSCGKGSPFEKLLQMQTKALLFDVSLRSLTFFHYVQDMFRDSAPVNLYEELPVESVVIDATGNTKSAKTYVFSSALRRHWSPHLRQALIQRKLINRQKIGNTQLTVLNLQEVVDCAQHMVRAGQSLWKM